MKSGLFAGRTRNLHLSPRLWNREGMQAILPGFIGGFARLGRSPQGEATGNETQGTIGVSTAPAIPSGGPWGDRPDSLRGSWRDWMVVEGRCFDCGEPAYPDILCSFCTEDADWDYLERKAQRELY